LLPVAERGSDRIVDRGPILIDGQTGEILWSAGPHPLRELMDGSFETRLVLPGFCDILSEVASRRATRETLRSRSTGKDPRAAAS
jgi:hypothetical protein